MHELSIAIGIVDAALDESQRRGVQVNFLSQRLVEQRAVAHIS
jgi:hypothetical protein